MPKRPHGEWQNSRPFTHKSFRPYVIALGQLALAWNDLHETLSMLFCTIMGGGYVNQFLAIWHTLKSDRAQRDILMASVANHFGYAEEPKKKLQDEIEWICGKANSLEDMRNDALHSPLWSVKRGGGTYRPLVTPLVGLGHVRANKLLGKNLLGEFRWCRDATTVLRNYAMEIDTALSRGQPLPDRPSLPNRGQNKGHKIGTAA